MPNIPWNTGEEVLKEADIRYRKGVNSLGIYNQLGSGVANLANQERKEYDQDYARQATLAQLAARRAARESGKAAPDEVMADSESPGHIDTDTTVDKKQPVSNPDQQSTGATPVADKPAPEGVNTPGSGQANLVSPKQDDGAKPATPSQGQGARPPTTKAEASSDRAVATPEDVPDKSRYGTYIETAKGMPAKSISALGSLGKSVIKSRFWPHTANILGFGDSQKQRELIEIGKRSGVQQAYDDEQKLAGSLGALGMRPKNAGKFYGRLLPLTFGGRGLDKMGQDDFYPPSERGFSMNEYEMRYLAGQGDPAAIRAIENMDRQRLTQRLSPAERVTAAISNLPSDTQKVFWAHYERAARASKPEDAWGLALRDMMTDKSVPEADRRGLWDQLGDLITGRPAPAATPPPKAPAPRDLSTEPFDSGDEGLSDLGSEDRPGSDRLSPRGRAKARAPIDENAIRPFDAAVKQAEKENNLPPGMLYAVLDMESDWNPGASNNVGSGHVGLAQFDPETAARYGVKREDPFSSIQGAGRYLRDLFLKTGNWVRALELYGGVATPGSHPYPDNVMAVQNKYKARLGDELIAGAGGGGSGAGGETPPADSPANKPGEQPGPPPPPPGPPPPRPRTRAEEVENWRRKRQSKTSTPSTRLHGLATSTPSTGGATDDDIPPDIAFTDEDQASKVPPDIQFTD